MNNWTIDETKRLFNLCYGAVASGSGLSEAFRQMSEETGHSVNSVRNYYYSQLKMFSLVPDVASDLGIKLVNTRREQFVTFDETEVDTLVRKVLTEKAKGNSVRKTIYELSNGDAKIALRLQNKYRSTLVHHKARVREIMAELESSGTPYFDPYEKKLSTEKSDNLSKLSEYIKTLDDSDVGRFLNLISKLV